MKALTEKAESGSIKAQYDLAKLYLMGRNIQNYDEAFNWLSKAAAQGHGEACFDLSKMIINQQGNN